MRTCYLCKGQVRSRNIDYMARKRDRYVLVKDLPVEQCEQCGEVYLDERASQRIDTAIAEAGEADEHLEVPVVHCR